MTDESANDIEAPPVSSISIDTFTTDGESSFVDLVVPKCKCQPYPAKYKSWLKVLVFVVFADWFSTEAGVIPWLQRTFGVRQNAAIFMFLGVVVGVLLYSALDMLNFVCPGLQTWMNQPRIRWVREYKNVPVECLAVVIGILEDGFRMFDTPPDPVVRPSRLAFDRGIEQEEDGKTNECTLKIQHKIRKDRVKEFQEWRRRLLKTMGLLDAKPKYGVTNVYWEPDTHGETQTTMITFQSIDDLNAYMQSPVRMRFMRNLQPLLVAPSQVKLRSNAITDLCYTQGQDRPERAPKKWKVWILTTFALYGVVIFCNDSLPHYIDTWKLDTTHERIPALLRNISTTFLNAYIATPFLTMIFQHWLRREDNDEEDHQPWIFLSEGTDSILIKTMIFVLFYGGTALAWYLQLQ